MTLKVCNNCGEIGFGILVPCSSCSYRPETGWEMWYGIEASDHKIEKPKLKELARIFPAGNVSNGNFLRMNDEQLSEFHKLMDNPSLRDVLELRRSGKSGWFNRRANFHFVGPDGYESRSVVRGKDISKREFDDIAGLGTHDVFLISVYIKGERDDRVVPKHLWYGLKDYFSLMGRSQSDGVINHYLTLNAMHYTREYLAARGFTLAE